MVAGPFFLPPVLFEGITATSKPVLVVAFLLAYSAQSVGKAFDVLSTIERWARTITGGIFVALGIYFCLKYIFDVI